MNRNPYTSGEVAHLVKYIAKYHPEVKGRLGTQLYKTLVEKPEKWPWARCHSWQSWREHYKKNQAELDRKIRRHLKERIKKQEGSGDNDHATQAQKDEMEQQQRRNQSRTVSNSKKAPKAVLKDPSRSQNTHPDPSHQEGTSKIERTNQKHTSSKLSKPRSIVTDSHKPGEVEGQVADNFAALKVEPGNQAHEPLVPVINTLAEVVDLTKTDDELMHELFGSSCEEDEEETQESDQLQTSSQADTSKTVKHKEVSKKKEHVAEAPEPVQELSQESTPPQSDTPVPVQVPATQRASLMKPKARPKLRKPVSSDPFETQSSSPPSRPRPQSVLSTKNTLPILVTEGFRTTLKRPRRSSTGNEDEHTWPPKRAKKDQRHVQPEPMDIDEPKTSKELPPLPSFKQTEHPVRQRPVQVNDVALSSTSRLPVNSVDSTAYSHVPVSKNQKPSDITKDSAPRTADPAISRRSSNKKGRGDAQPSPIYMQKPESGNEFSPPPLKQRKHLVRQRPVQVNAVASSSSSRLPFNSVDSTSHNQVSVPTKQKTSGLNTRSPAFKPGASPIPWTSTFVPPEAPLSDSDPFVGRTSSNDKGKARAEFSINLNPPPRIDLHQQRLKRRLTNTSGSTSAHRDSRRPSLAPSISSKQRKQRVPRPSLVDTAEFLEIARQEMAKKLALMVTKRGIDFEFAHETYMRVKNLEDTDFILQKVYERDLRTRAPPRISLAGRAPHRATGVARMDKPTGTESSDEVPNGLVLRQSSATASHPRDQAKTHPRPRKSGRPSLVIRPIPPGDESYYLSDYSPPNKTRAGQFARLEKQGRFEEALEREKRRVSGFYVAETQVQKEASPSPPPSEASPSPKGQHSDAPMEVDESQAPDADADDDVMRQEAKLDEYIMQDDATGVQYEVVDQDVVEEQSVADVLSEGEPSEIGEHDDADDAESVASVANDVDDDEDDMSKQEVGHEADDESEEGLHEGGHRNSSPPYPSTRALIKRLSGGRERDPAFLAETEEHRRLALNMTEENESEMRTFEEGHNPELLRLWSIKWMRELQGINPNHSVDQSL